MTQADPLPPGPLRPAIDTLLRADPPRATRFIVTIYGDVVEPRGGLLWMGTLIEICAAHGISETLVRTAVSRLVAAGKLSGERAGRRSYYRLTPAARTEFTAAARVLFAPPPVADGWLIAPAAPHGLAMDLLAPGWAALGDGVLIGPDRADLPPAPGPILRASPFSGSEELPALAARLWDLAGLAEAYGGFLDRFAPVADELAGPGTLPGATSLAVRLLLVDRYRAVVLRDPRLPAAALPAGWPGQAARALFVRLYLRLARSADSHVGHAFHAANGLLPATSEATALRLDRLAAEAASLEF
ncbi:PaaX family transcriptional regulator C-terminal domain-containing protein [Segnochrobactraceae bacterium EtOH-i3]